MQDYTKLKIYHYRNDWIRIIGQDELDFDKDHYIKPMDADEEDWQFIHRATTYTQFDIIGKNCKKLNDYLGDITDQESFYKAFEKACCYNQINYIYHMYQNAYVYPENKDELNFLLDRTNNYIYIARDYGGNFIDEISEKFDCPIECNIVEKIARLLPSKLLYEKDKIENCHIFNVSDFLSFYL